MISRLKVVINDVILSSYKYNLVTRRSSWCFNLLISCFLLVGPCSSTVESVRTYVNHVCGTLFHMFHVVAHVCGTMCHTVAQCSTMFHNHTRVAQCYTIWHNVPQKFTRKINEKEQYNEQERILTQTSWLMCLTWVGVAQCATQMHT